MTNLYIWKLEEDVNALNEALKVFIKAADADKEREGTNQCYPENYDSLGTLGVALHSLYTTIEIASLRTPVINPKPLK